MDLSFKVSGSTISISLFLYKFGGILYCFICCSEAAFERRQKRRRLFGEQSISPVQFEESGEPEYSKKKPSFQKEIAPLDKHSFLGLFNLESARPHAKKRNYFCFELF